MGLHLFERSLSTWPAVVILLSFFVISQSWILITLAETGEDVGRLQTICLAHPRNPGAAARDILGNWTARDIQNFQRHFLADKWIHPILYSLFFVSAFLHDLFHRQQKPEKRSQVLLGRSGSAIIFFAGLCDILENIRHSKIQFRPALNAPDDILVEACVLASTKWIIMGAVSSWLIWRYGYAPKPGSIFKGDSKSLSQIETIWNGPMSEDFSNTQTKAGLLDVQGRLIPWTRTAPGASLDVNRSYTVSPYAHYIGYTWDEIRIHLAGRPIVSFLAERMVAGVGCLFSLLNFDQAVYFNNYLLSTNVWPTTIKWSPMQVHMINQEFMNNAKNQNRAIIWRSVDPMSQPCLTEVLSESPTCLLIPARVMNWTEFSGDDLGSSEIVQKKDFRLDLNLFRKRVGWDVVKQEPAEASNAEFRLVTLDPQAISLQDAEQIVSLFNQLYIDKYSRRNPQLTPEGLIRMARVGFFSVDVLRRRSNDEIVGFCTWSVVDDDVGTSAFVGYDIQNDLNRDLYRLVMMMIHGNVVKSGVNKCHMSGGANRFKRRRGAKSAVEYNAVFVNHLPFYQQLPWRLTQWVAGKVITVERAK